MRDFTPLWPGGPVFAQAENQRLSTDCVLLADFVQLRGSQRGIDLGCASGAISLLLLVREGRLHMTGLELNTEAAETARENMAKNGLAGRCRILSGDIRTHRELFAAGSFDLVVANPPYFPPERGRTSPNPAREAARIESCCTLEDLCRASRWLLPSGGSFALVHRPERLSELFCTMTAHGIEPKRLRMVLSQPGRAPSLVLVEGRRDGKPGLSIEPALVLRNTDGSESEEYRRIYHRA